MSLGEEEALEVEKADDPAAAAPTSNGARTTLPRTNGRSFDRRMLKKSDLYRSLWKGADELRGGMDASQYKDYVLTLLFVKYVSDRGDRTLLEVPDGAHWSDIKRLRDDKEIGDKLNKIISRIAEANDLHGVIDLADFNDENKLGRGKEMVDRLSKLVGIFDDLDFGLNTAEGDDLLGDAYEYLMRHFATESGKSKGQFYTPAEVSMILARVVGISPSTTPDQTVYDPTCGSGALLLKAASEAPRGMSIYGQEMDNATFALARMNTILHGYETAELWHGNTLASPHYKDPDGSLKKFDFAVANPPFSVKAWTTGLNPAADEFGRFEGFGIPPEKNGDYAFLLHILKSLKSTGKAAVILPHGVLFRGGREADIRRELVKRRLIKGIVSLPVNLFYGTSIPACVVVLDKEGTASRKGIFLIDASRGFVKDGNKNRLRAQDIHKIVDVFTSQTEVESYSRLVPFGEIESKANDYNLNLPRYIDSGVVEDVHDIDAHLHGGIPNGDIENLAPFWSALPGLEEFVFADAGRPGYSHLRLERDQLRASLLEHPVSRSFVDRAQAEFSQWGRSQKPALEGIQVGSRPKELITELAETLLDRFRSLALIDPYRVYQRLMDYWVETMQDDVFKLSAQGWAACFEGVPDVDLVPVEIVISEYLAEEQAEVDTIAVEAENAMHARQAYEEEHGEEDGLLADARAESGKLTAASVKARISEIKTSPAFADELECLENFRRLVQSESAAKKTLKQREARLYDAALARYEVLSEPEVRTLIVDAKWMSRMATDVRDEAQGVLRGLISRLAELDDRYARPLGALVANADQASERVAGHLRAMGLV